VFLPLSDPPVVVIVPFLSFFLSLPGQ